MKNKKYFCYEIYKNLAVWSNNGKLAYNPCSFFTGYIKESTEFDLDLVWNGPERDKLKKCVETDTPIAGCQGCYSAEAKGLDSRRQGAKRLYEEFHKDTTLDLDGPQGIDYSVGNLCNLKCVICGPQSSTQWIPDYQKLHPGSSVEIFQYNKYNQVEITQPELLKNIKSVHFHGGGEPLLSDNHTRLLTKILEVKGLADVRVFYNVNGTQTVSDHTLKLWEKCKLIELYFSVDGVGEQFDYQRTNAHWPTVSANLKWFYENMPHNHMFNINCTWSYLNFYCLDQVYDWWKNSFSTNRYRDPTNLIFQKALGTYSLDHLSLPAHQAVANRFQQRDQLQALLKSIPINDRPHDRFWRAITALDQVRNTDFKAINPEWSKLIS